MSTERLQQTILEPKTVEKLKAEIQSKFLNILNDADFPAILKKNGILDPSVLKFEFRLDVTKQAPCNDAATTKPDEKLKQLQQDIERELLKEVNQAGFPAILAKYGELNPQVLTFKFRISGCGPNCVCSCWDPVRKRWVPCEC